MSSTSANLCTPSGICPSQSMSTVFETLGTTGLQSNQDESGELAIYIAEDFIACWLEVSVQDETVSELCLACQP